MKLDIIVPCYNAEKYLDNLLESIYIQEVNENKFNTIFIDDGSTDGTWNILQEWKSQKSNMTVIRQNNQGVSAARNRGIEESKGQYIWFIDSDDYIIPGCLSLILDRIESILPEIVVFKKIKRVSEDASIHDEQVVLRLEDMVVPSTFSANNIFSCIYDSNIIHGNLTVRKSVGLCEGAGTIDGSCWIDDGLLGHIGDGVGTEGCVIGQGLGLIDCEIGGGGVYASVLICIMVKTHILITVFIWLLQEKSRGA